MKQEATMQGPVGTSQYCEIFIPSATEISANTLASIAICPGVLLKFLALEAGMISKAVINKTPTNFIAMANTTAKAMINSQFTV